MGTAKKAAPARKATSIAKKTSTAKAITKKPAPKVAPARKPKTPRARVEKITLATLAAKLDTIAERLSTLEAVLGAALAARAPEGPPASAPGSVNHPIASADFDAALLATIGDLDRRARHGGMVPIPDVRTVCLDAGWTRAAFDARLLEAERDFLVDLKVANDPLRLPRPDLAIEELGRGHLQYVVIR